MKKANKEISKDMLILDLVETYPQLIEVLTIKYGLHCIGCHAAAEETLAEGAMVHGMTPKKVEKMVIDLNKLVKVTK